jgi:hypothetical protein
MPNRRRDAARGRSHHTLAAVLAMPADCPDLLKTSPPNVRHHPSGEMPDLTVQDFALALGLRRELASLL